MTATKRTSKKRKTETAEEMVNRWIRGSVGGFGYADLLAAGWEGGQDGYTTVNGVNYEKYDVPGGYVVVEWDECGNVNVY